MRRKTKHNYADDVRKIGRDIMNQSHMDDADDPSV